MGKTKFISWERDTSSLQWQFINSHDGDPGTCNDVSSALPICLLAQALVCINISCYETRIPQHRQNLAWIRYPWGIMPLTLLWTDVCIPTKFSQLANYGKLIPFGVLQRCEIHSLIPMYIHNDEPWEANIVQPSKICDHVDLWVLIFGKNRHLQVLIQ